MHLLHFRIAIYLCKNSVVKAIYYLGTDKIVKIYVVIIPSKVQSDIEILQIPRNSMSTFEHKKRGKLRRVDVIN